MTPFLPPLYYSDLEISRQLTFFGLKAGENLVQEQKEDEVERHGSAQLWWKKVAELVVPTARTRPCSSVPLRRLRFPELNTSLTPPAPRAGAH